MPPGRPRNPERNRKGDIRYRARYEAARGLGVTGAEARAAACSIDRFRALIVAHGRDLAEFGDLAVRMLGGWPRKNPEFRERYHTLRARGVSALDCSDCARSQPKFERAMKRLDMGLPAVP